MTNCTMVFHFLRFLNIVISFSEVIKSHTDLSDFLRPDGSKRPEVERTEIIYVTQIDIIKGTQISQIPQIIMVLAILIHTVPSERIFSV